MRLRQISEGKPIVKNAGEAFGDLIQFVRETPGSEEEKAITKFLADPTAPMWEQTRWVVKAAIQRALVAKKDDLKQRAETWGQLADLSAPVAAASVRVIPRQDVKGTPLQKTTLSHTNQEKLMASLGPQGFVSTMSNLEGLPASKTKDMLKRQAEKSRITNKAVQRDIPGAKITKKF